LIACFCADLNNAAAQLNHARTQAGGQAAPAAANNQSIIGNWQGELDVGTAKLRLVLKLTQASTGQFAATLDSLDQPGSNDLPLEHVAYADRILSFDFNNPAAPARFEGVVSRDGTEINGHWRQSDQSRPLVFTRTGAAVAIIALPPALLANPRRRLPLN